MMVMDPLWEPLSKLLPIRFSMIPHSVSIPMLIHLGALGVYHLYSSLLQAPYVMLPLILYSITIVCLVYDARSIADASPTFRASPFPSRLWLASSYFYIVVMIPQSPSYLPPWI